MRSPTAIRTRKLALRKLKDGGHSVVDDEGNQIGVLDHKELTAYMQRYQEGLQAPYGMTSAVQGLPHSHIDQQVKRATSVLMRDTGLPFGKAIRAVFRQNSDLAARYHEAHRGRAD